jgi:hypothetical protein
MGFILALAKDRHKHTFMPMLNFVNNILSKDPSSVDPSAFAREKDGALAFISCLADITLSPKSKVREQMDTFVVSCVLPEFRSPFPFLRARACQVLIAFGSIEFEEEKVWHTIFESTLQCLHDTELPVKVYAAQSLQVLIQHEIVREAIVPHLNFIMQG